MGNKSSSMLQDEEIKQISEQTGFSPSQIEKLYSRFSHLDRGNCGNLSKNDLMLIPELAINPLCDRLIQIFFSDCDPQETDERINFKQFIKVLATFRSTPSSTHSNSNNNNNNNIDNNGLTSTTSRQFKNNNNGHTETVVVSETIPTTQIKPQLSSSGRYASPYSQSSDGGNNDHSNKQQHQTTLSYVTKVKGFNDNKLTSGKDINYVQNMGLNDTLRDKLLFIFRIYDADNDGRISFHDLRSILKMMVGTYIEDLQLDKIANRALVEVDEDNDGFIEFSEFCKVFSAKDLDDKLRVKFFN